MTLAITSIMPSTQRFGEDTIVTVLGTDFTSPLQLFVDALSPVEVLQVVVASNTSITGIIPGVLSKGVYNIRVRLGDGSEATLENGFAVVPPTPASPFATQTFGTTMNRLLQRMASDYDVREGSTIWDLLAPVAIEVEEIYSKLNEFLRLVFIPDSAGSYLDLIGLEHGIIRLAATYATGVVKFTGTSALTVSEGFQVSNTIVVSDETVIIFATDEDVTLSDVGGGIFEGTVAVTAVRTGASGNLTAGEVNNLIDSQSGLTAVTNAAAMAGGSNEENDPTFKNRIMRSVAEPTHGGNIADYIKWAQEVDGVGKVGVDPLAGGAGTVSVYFLDRDGNLPNATLITAVQDYIDPAPVGEGEGKAPIGATVTVSAPTEITINVVSTIVLSSGAVEAEVKADVETNLRAYIKDLNLGENVRFYGISGIILNTAGVDTISALTVNAAGIDIVIAADEKAVAGTITITV